MLKILIKNAKVLDGTGSKAFQADVGIQDGKIAAIAAGLEAEAIQVLDAAGLMLAPGFIDPHTHSDQSLLLDRKAQSKIRQGVTTEVVGNCGYSPAPLYGDARREALADAREYDYEINWEDMGGYLAQFNDPGVAVNVVPLVGHNTIRGCVLGYEDVQPNAEQQKAMERLTAEAMQQGARGMSTGLFYPPGYYAKTDEVIGLARVVAGHSGVYASHIRSESDELFESIEEAIEIGRRSGARVHISHLKLEGAHNFEGADRVLDMIETANQQGIAVGTDQYPYAASSTWLGAILPNWAQAGGAAAVGKRLADAEVRARLREDWKLRRVEWQNRSGVTDWEQILVVSAPGLPEAIGHTMAQIAAQEGKDPLEAVFDLIETTSGGAAGVFFDQLEDNVQTLMRYPRLVIGSDGSALSREGRLASEMCHPRSYGTFPRVLGRYVRELKVLSLEEAVHKMTQLPAQYFKLQDRGVVQVGSWADLVLFDADTVIDRATFTEPRQYPEGIPHVMVNGVWVIADGEHTGALPGRVI